MMEPDIVWTIHIESQAIIVHRSLRRLFMVVATSKMLWYVTIKALDAF